MIYDVIIIGAGPAGMTAGIYCARKKLKTLILTKDIGGQTAWSSDIENYLGFTMMTGAQLVEKFEHHVEEFKDDVELRLTTKGVTKIEKVESGFTVTLGDGKTEHAKAIIVTSGKVPRKLGVPGESEFLNKGVSYCAWCDGPIFAGKTVAIVGGGNAALDSALTLAKMVKQLYIINITEELTADKMQVDKAKAADNIRIINNAETIAIKGDKFVKTLEFEDKTSRVNKEIPVDGIFIDVGQIPADDFIKDFVKLNDDHEVIIDNHNMTSVEGVFAAGDVTIVPEKQIIVAAGEGAKAAIQASQYLARK